MIQEMRAPTATQAPARAVVLGIGTAVPEHCLKQTEARDFAERIFAGAFRDLDRLLPVFENTLIEERRIAEPLEWYGAAHTFAESNAAYLRVALRLSVEAAEAALLSAGLAATDVERIVFVSSTGIATPSLDAALLSELGCRPSVGRLPVWGLGCAGGVAGLARALELAYAASGPVLLVAVELCSLTFQHKDRSKSNLIAVSLFGDGAAALIVAPGKTAPRHVPVSQTAQLHSSRPGVVSPRFELLSSFSHLFPDSEDIMGWDLVDGGLKVRFSRDIPALVRSSMPGLLEQACTVWGIEPGELQHYVLHPGGARVLAAYEESLGVTSSDLAAAYEALRRYGNVSSASVLFVLQRFLESVQPTGELGVMAALGPGFSAELLLFRY